MEAPKINGEILTIFDPFPSRISLFKMKKYWPPSPTKLTNTGIGKGLFINYVDKQEGRGDFPNGTTKAYVVKLTTKGGEGSKILKILST